jgi:hypothetical protein
MPSQDGGVQLVTREQKASFDPATKKAYATQNLVIETYATADDLEDETVEPLTKQEQLEERKVFEKDGFWYRNIYAPYQGTPSSYHKVNKEVAYVLMEEEVKETFNAPFFEQLMSIDYSQMKNAYESVYAEQLAQEKLTAPSATAMANVAVTEANGETALSIVTSTTTVREMMNYANDSELMFTTKDDKLTELYSKQTFSQSAEILGQTISFGMSNVSTMTIDYAFDQAGYDAIETGYNSNVDYSNEILMELELTALGYQSSTGLTTAYANQTAESWFGSYAGWYVCWGDVDVTWYTDEACTQPFDLENKTALDIQNVKKVYGQATAVEGYAIVIEKSSYIDNRSAKYKNILDTAGSIKWGPESFGVAEKGSTNYFALDSEADEIWLNGVKQEAGVETYLVEGDVYNVEYKYFTTDANEDIFVLMD